MTIPPPEAGAIIDLEPRAYPLPAPIDGHAPHVTLRGVPGMTVLSCPSGIIHGDFGPYHGWSFEGIAFDGGGGGFATILNGSRGVRFRRCSFRNASYLAWLVDPRGLAFDDCGFEGLREGLFQPGVMDPPAVPTAALSDGIVLASGFADVSISRCRFHFLRNGVLVSGGKGQSCDGLAIERSAFRGDWWDGHAAVLRGVATSVQAGPGGGYVLTAIGGGLAAACTDSNIVSFRRDLAAGTGFADVGPLSARSPDLIRAAIGDVIETADGRRGRVAAVAEPGSLGLEGWEATDTYLPCDPPEAGVGWRLVRYYACGTVERAISDTQVALYLEPVNPFSGERALSDARLNLANWPFRIFAKSVYSGIHINGAVRGLDVSHNAFRGSWGDQISVYDLPEGGRILGNRVSLGFDGGTTVYRSPGTLISGNVYSRCGTAAVFLGESPATSVRGNTVAGWGVVNPGVGAIHGDGCNLAIGGNLFAPPPTPLRRDWCRWAINLTGGDCTGSLVAGNSDPGATLATVTVDAKAVPRKNAVTVRDARSVVGPGRPNVHLGD